MSYKYFKFHTKFFIDFENDDDDDDIDNNGQHDDDDDLIRENVGEYENADSSSKYNTFNYIK